MNWAAWLLVANIGIAWIEHTYRAGQYPTFYTALPYITLPILISQWALFEGFRAAPSLFVAGAFFSIINVGFRIGNSFVLGENLNLYNWLGVVMLAASAILLRVK